MRDRINICIVGLRFGRGMTKRDVYEGKGGEYLNITAVCDLDKERADEYASEIGAKAYYDFNEVLKDPDIEAVGLFTPPGGRAKLIRKCIAAGKHVLTTKPFELIPEEAYSVLEEARQNNIVVHLNSPGPLLTPEMEQVAKWRRDYDLGRPVSGVFEVMMDKNEVPDGTWYDDPDLCPAAPLYRIGIYAVNDMINMLSSRPVSAVCLDSRIRTGRPTADNAALSVKFENGAIGVVQSSFCAGNGDVFIGSYIVQYERGTICRGPYVVREDGSIDKYDLTIRWRTKDGKLSSEEYRCKPEDERSGNYLWEEFYKAVRSGGRRLDGEIAIGDIVNGVCIVDAMKRSLKSGAVEEIKPY